MNWKTCFLPEAEKDLQRLDGAQRILVLKAIRKTQTNPLPIHEGGYGKPLGGGLSGFMKIKLRNAGIRVVYKLMFASDEMLVVVIGARADDEVYETARHRALKYNI